MQTHRDGDESITSLLLDEGLTALSVRLATGITNFLTQGCAAVCTSVLITPQNKQPVWTNQPFSPQLLCPPLPLGLLAFRLPEEQRVRPPPLVLADVAEHLLDGLLQQVVTRVGLPGPRLAVHKNCACIGAKGNVISFAALPEFPTLNCHVCRKDTCLQADSAEYMLARIWK